MGERAEVGVDGSRSCAWARSSCFVSRCWCTSSGCVTCVLRSRRRGAARGGRGTNACEPIPAVRFPYAAQRLLQQPDKDQEIRQMLLRREQDPEPVRLLLERRRTDVDNHLERGEELEGETRCKLEIQSRLIHLKDFYRELYARITRGVEREHRVTTLLKEQLLERTFVRRNKLNKAERGRDERKGEGFKERQSRHREIYCHLQSHKEDFIEWHRRKAKDRKKMTVQVRANVEGKKREKEEQEEKKKQILLKILKEQNMEKYLQIVEEEKKSRIREVLMQTNRFLKELGARVMVQKGGVSEAEEPVQALEEGDLKEIFQSSNALFYNLTHTISEEVTKQPAMLTGGELKTYQLHGLKWLVSLYNNNLNGILADEMGLGKTIQTIALVCYLMESKKNPGPYLIVAPLSTISNWVAELDKWAPHVRKIVYKGNPGRRAEALRLMRNSRWNMCITTYDFILKDRLKLNKYEWKYIVIDEGHKMKNAKGKFSSVLGQQYSSEHRLLLTGTPLQNNLSELWALLNFLLPAVFNSCDDFEKWFSMGVYKATGAQSVALAEEEQMLIINRLHQVLRPFLLRRVKKEVYAQLPDKKEHVVKVAMSAWQQMLYDNISNNTALQYASHSGKVSRTTLTNLVMQLRKCCNHPFLFLPYQDFPMQFLIRAAGKFQLLDRILPKLLQFGHRLLIFTQMTQLMNIMKYYFQLRGVRHLRLDGSTKPQDRQQSMRLFNEVNSQFDVFLLSTRAGGLGLNLQTADTVIIFDSDWNPQMDLQAQDRVHRIGQEKQVIVLRLITAHSIEESILERTALKMNLNELFIQGGLYNLNSSEAERRQKIEDILLKRKNTNDDNQEEEILDDDMLNQYLSRSDEEYQQFTRMDAERKLEASSLPRLMEPCEIPSWFNEVPKTEKTERDYGRGHRVKQPKNYYQEFDQQLNSSLGQEADSPPVERVQRQEGRRKVMEEQLLQERSEISQEVPLREEMFEDD